MFTELIIKGESYKLRLTTKASVGLEKALGYNAIGMFMDIDKGVMPKLGDILIVLHATLQAYNHGITLEKVYELFDDYVEDGHNMYDLIPLFVEVFQQSGYMPANKEQDEGNAEKN
ncbi:MAG: hypothetical protein IKY67_06625 [Paludibacteraceae bacterium]|nr:hypothetical protein [Paludibacteraceae bacterium]